MAQTTKASAIGGGLTCHERIPPGADVPCGQTICATSKQSSGGDGMIRLSIGQRAWLIGSESAGQIVGVAWRNGGIVYALRGVAGVWPSWLVVAW